MHIRKASIADAKTIHAILMEWSDKGMLLPRSLSQIYMHLRDFFVLEQENGTVIGCCSLMIYWEDLAEIRSLAIRSDECRKGYGTLLLNATIDEARELGLKNVFALTYQVDFFTRMGFTVVPKDTMPQKVWSDCINCPRFPNCNEVAVSRTV